MPKHPSDGTLKLEPKQPHMTLHTWNILLNDKLVVRKSDYLYLASHHGLRGGISKAQTMSRFSRMMVTHCLIKA